MAEPPAHVCRALYEFDPKLRLCWLGVPFEHESDARRSEEGAFGVCVLTTWSRVMDADGNRKTEHGFRESLAPLLPEITDRGVRIFDKNGRPRPDYDATTQVPLLFMTVSPQWNMSTADVYGSRLLAVLRQSPQTQREAREIKRRALLEKGKRRKADVQEMADGIGRALHYDVSRANVYDGAETIQDRVDRAKAREERQKMRVGVENMDAWKAGLM